MFTVTSSLHHDLPPSPTIHDSSSDNDCTIPVHRQVRLPARLHVGQATHCVSLPLARRQQRILSAHNRAGADLDTILILSWRRRSPTQSPTSRSPTSSPTSPTASPTAHPTCALPHTLRAQLSQRTVNTLGPGFCVPLPSTSNLEKVNSREEAEAFLIPQTEGHDSWSCVPRHLLRALGGQNRTLETFQV